MRMGRCPGTNKRARPTGFAPRIERQLLFPGRFGLFPRALGRFGHETFLDGGCRNTDVTHLAVYDRLDALQVGHEAPLRDCSHVRTDAALFLGLAAAPNNAAFNRAFAGQFTKSSHINWSPKRSAEPNIKSRRCKPLL